MPRYRFLYVDHGYRRRVRTWNAVDVLGEDGLFQHGTVVDIDADGLVVDFSCTGQRRQLVDYAKVFRVDMFSYRKVLQPGCAVEVLLRPDKQRPWLWLPAKVLTVDIPGIRRPDLAFVELSLSGAREIVDYEQVRLPPSFADLQSLVSRQGDFVLGSVCPLRVGLAGFLPSSSGLWPAFCHKLRDHMSYLYEVWAISVSSEKLVFLQLNPLIEGLHTRYPFYAQSLEYKIWSAERNLGKNMERNMGPIVWAKGWRCCLSALEDGVVEERGQGWGWSLEHVSQHVLREAFSHLDTMDRVSHRRVCGAWDLLLSGMLSADIRLCGASCNWPGAFRKACGSCSLKHAYPIAAPLLKCVTAQTRRITLIHAKLWVIEDVLFNLALCGQLGRLTADQQVTVVAFQCDVGSANSMEGVTCASYNLGILAEAMTGVWCHRLLLRQCTLCDTIPLLRLSGDVGTGLPLKDVWQALDSPVPAFDAQRLADWVALAVRSQSTDCDVILEILHVFTQPDPRSGNVYAGQEWTVDNLASLDVTKLSRVAQYALSVHVLPEFSLRDLFDQLPIPEDM